MSNGTIRIEQVCSQYAKIRNAGGAGSVNVAKFLEKNRHHFLTMSDGPLHTAHALTNDRIDNFAGYASANGFKIVWGWS